MPARKRFVPSLLLICSAFTVVTFPGACNSFRESYYIGAPDGVWIRRPMELALDEINALRGVGGSRPAFRGVSGTIRLFRDGECRRLVSVLE